MPAVWMLWNSELETELNANRVFIPHSSPILNPELDPSVFAGIHFSPSSLLSHPRLLRRRAGEPRRPPHPVTGGPCRHPLPQPAGWRAAPSSPLSPAGREPRRSPPPVTGGRRRPPLLSPADRRTAPLSPPSAGGLRRAPLPHPTGRLRHGTLTPPAGLTATSLCSLGGGSG